MEGELGTSGGVETQDRMQMLKAFDKTKAGVKGLTDSRLAKVAKIFIRPDEELAEELIHEKGVQGQHKVPVIDLSGLHDPDRRMLIVQEVRIASETWGFFQVLHHGIPPTVLEGMIDGVQNFHETNIEEKKKYYSRDAMRTVRFNSSYDLFTSRTASWRDTLSISFSSPDEVDPQKLPDSCREPALSYSKHVEILGNHLLGLLSEAIGLKTDHLQAMECSLGHRLHCHYYPPCPQPEIAIGTTRHSDSGFLTILLQNQVKSGLQVLHQGQWIDIPPIPDGLVINIGDLLQLVSNGKFRSNEHRAKASRVGPRITVACFFSGPVNGDKIYSPIADLLSEESPAVYREVVLSEYVVKFLTTGLESYRGFRLLQDLKRFSSDFSAVQEEISNVSSKS